MNGPESFKEFYERVSLALADRLGRNCCNNEESISKVSSEISKVLEYDDGGVDVHVSTTVVLRPEINSIDCCIEIDFSEKKDEECTAIGDAINDHCSTLRKADEKRLAKNDKRSKRRNDGTPSA